MMEKKLNYGWVLTLIAWVLSSGVIPFLPEFMEGQSILAYPLMEYIATIGLFAAFFLIIWIPVGIGAAKAYRTNGIKKSLLVVGPAFLILLLLWTLIFKFLWNS